MRYVSFRKFVGFLGPFGDGVVGFSRGGSAELAGLSTGDLKRLISASFVSLVLGRLDIVPLSSGLEFCLC